MADGPDFGQGLHGRAVEQPLLAIQSLGREPAGPRVTELERPRLDRIGSPFRDWAIPSNTRWCSPCSRSVSETRTRRGSTGSHSPRNSRTPWLSYWTHWRARTSRSSSRTRPGGTTSEPPARPSPPSREWQHRQPLQPGLDGRDVTAAQRVVLRHRVAGRCKGVLLTIRSPRPPFPDRPDPGSRLGTAPQGRKVGIGVVDQISFGHGTGGAEAWREAP